MAKVTSTKAQVAKMLETAQQIESHCIDKIVSVKEIEACIVNHKDRFRLALKVQGQELTIKKDFMLGQVAGRSRVPAQYLSRITMEDPELAVRCVASGFQKNSGEAEDDVKEMKVRIYAPPGEPTILRGLVTTRYMPMSNAEILKNFAEMYPLDSLEIEKFNIDEYGMTIQSRSILQESKDKELKVGDIFPGFSLTNNEVSLGAFEVLCRLYRLACTNGMVIVMNGGSKSGRKIHLGGGDDGGKFIREYLTNQLGQLNAQLEHGIPLIRKAMETKVDIDQFYHGLRKKENIKNEELSAIFEGWAYEKSLGKNLWGAVNGVTRMARDQKDISQAHRFERLGGSLIQFKESQVRGLEAIGRSYLEEMTAKGKAVLISSS